MLRLEFDNNIQSKLRSVFNLSNLGLAEKLMYSFLTVQPGLSWNPVSTGASN